MAFTGIRRHTVASWDKLRKLPQIELESRMSGLKVLKSRNNGASKIHRTEKLSDQKEFRLKVESQTQTYTSMGSPIKAHINATQISLTPTKNIDKVEEEISNTIFEEAVEVEKI